MNCSGFSSALLLVLSLADHLSAQSVSLQLDREAGPARLSINAEPGFDYRLEAATSPAPPGEWEFLATLRLDGGSQSWLDSQSGVLPQRFYRAVKTGPASPEPAADFRLIDQLGRSRWLYYHLGMPQVRGIVLIFTGNGCVPMREMVPTIAALTNQFTPQGVLFWLIDSNAGDNRSNILAEATALGLSNGPPILHDAAQLVARSYHAATTPEAIAIDTSGFVGVIFYHGAIDDRLGSDATTTTQHYLSNALTSFLAGGNVSPRETRPAGCAITLNPAFSNLSYARDIAPLLQAKCLHCHSPGNIAPWAMTNYEIVQLNAPYIREQVMNGNMPPWHADPFYSSFTNDTSLRADEAAKIIQWIDTGAPRGDEPDPLAQSPPPPTNYPYAWPSSLGQPDQILRIPAQHIPPTGTIDYKYITVTNTAFTNDVWLRAAIARPGNSRVVHHCLVFEGDAISSLGGLAGFYSGYVPGFDPTTFPASTGKLLKKGQVLTFQMHYISVGSDQTDQTELGLYVAPAPPSHPLQTKAAFNISIAVPANSADYQTTAQFPGSGTLTTNILLYEMSPHMHLRGSRFKFEVIYPTGGRETLLSVPNYIFHWQTLYRLTQPQYIPRGSRILCTAAWDNTAQNVELMEAYNSTGNALYLPDHAVRFNEQSWDEMFIGYLNFAEVPGP